MQFRTFCACLVSGTLAVGSACTGASEGATPETDPPEPTFLRAEAENLAHTFMTSSLGDLVPPTQAGAPWTVVGSILDPDVGESTAAVWSSVDAETWERTDVPPADPEVSESFAALVAHPAGRLAVGGVGSGSTADAAFWREVDGAWQRLEVPGAAGDGVQSVSDVVTDGTGILALGFENVDGDGRPLLWFSADGTEWQAVDGGSGGTFDTEGDEAVVDIASGPSGFVAVGYRDGESDVDGLAWISADGVEWQPAEIPSPEGATHWSLSSVAAAPGGYSIGGSVTTAGVGTRPAVWRSADGRSWSPPSSLPLHDDGPSAPAGFGVDHVTATADGWLATGGRWLPHVWQSADGASWNLAPDVTDVYFPEGVRIGDIDGAGGVVVAVGSPSAVLRLAGGSWHVREGAPFPSGGAEPYVGSVTVSGETVIVGGGRDAPASSDRFGPSTGAVWTRGADGTWERHTIGLDAGPVHDVVATSAATFAVGIEQRLGAVRRGGDNYGPDAVVWARQDDDSWQRIGTAPLPPVGSSPDGPFEGAEPPSAPPLGGPGNTFLNEAVPLGGGWIAVGGAYADDAGGVWQGDGLVVASGDGTSWGGEDAAAGGPGDQQFNGVCAAPDGSAVAVGTSSDRADGEMFVRHRDPQGVWSVGAAEGGGSFADQGHSAITCAAAEDGYIVVGEVENGDDTDAAAWTSPDGVTWTRLDDDALGGDGDQSASAVVAVPSGGWLLGGGDDSGGDDDAALWRIDPDGDVTRRDAGEDALGGRGDQHVYDIAVVGDGLVVVGSDHLRIGLWESPVIDR